MASATASSPPPARHALTPTSPIDKAVVVAVAALASTVPACFFDREILFTYHPVFMTLAFACFATIGAWIAALSPADEADLCDFLRGLPADVAVFPMGVGSNLCVREGGLRAVIRAPHKGINYTCEFFQKLLIS